MAKRLAKKQGMPSAPGISDEDFTDDESSLDEDDKSDSAGGFAA